MRRSYREVCFGPENVPKEILCFILIPQVFTWFCSYKEIRSDPMYTFPCNLKWLKSS